MTGHHVWTWCVLLGAFVLHACGGGRDAADTRSVARSAARGVVAWVGDEPIGRDELVAHARRHGLSAREALTDFEDRLLLAQEGRRRGYRPTLGIAARDRALVALLLADLEREVGPRSLSARALADAAASARAAHEIKARRVYRQVVFVLPRNATMDTVSKATALAEEELLRARAEGLTEATGPRIADGLRARADGFDVLFEPRVEREFDGRRARTNYETALLGLPLGLGPRVLVSSRGLHVLEVLGRSDALEPSIADVEDEATDAALVRAREPVVAARIEAARARTRIVVDEALAARRLALVRVDAP